MQIARQTKSGMCRFRLPLTADDAYQHLGAFYNAEVEYRNRRCQFTEFTLDKIWRMATALTAENPKLGVLLTGKVGNGKTTLLKALASTIGYMGKIGKYRYQDFGYEHVSDFGLAIRTAKELSKMCVADHDRYDELTVTPLLGIDELGEEPKEVLEYGNVFNPIVDLIETRYNRQKFTVITTNLDANEIGDRYGSRFRDRLREMLELIPFGNYESYRQ